MGMTYGGRGVPIDIGKFKDNFDKDGKLRCFNCNIWTHSKGLPKIKERDTRKCYKYDKIRHIARDYRGQKIKNRSIQENTDKETNNKQESFVEGLE